MVITCLQPLWKSPPSTFLCPSSSSILQDLQRNFGIRSKDFQCCDRRRIGEKRIGVIVCGLPLPVDPWAPTIDSQSIASQLFAFSLFPYIGFLYFITKSNSAPKLTLFGFYFLLAFVGATILISFMSIHLCPLFNGVVPAGIYAKVHYGTSLSNVDWLHGGAESLLTLTNLFIVLGLREALRKGGDAKQSSSDVVPGIKEEKPSI